MPLLGSWLVGCACLIFSGRGGAGTALGGGPGGVSGWVSRSKPRARAAPGRQADRQVHGTLAALGSFQGSAAWAWPQAWPPAHAYRSSALSW